MAEYGAQGQAVETKGTNPQSGGVFGQVVGTGLGLLTANYNDRRQERLNRKMMAQQMAGAKEMGKFNQELALDTWQKTGYGAQRKQMEAAGLNVGLMYGGTGAGGTTQGGQSQMPSTSAAPSGGGELGMGIASAAQMMMIKAQIENINADTKLKNVEAGKKGGVDTENVVAGTGKIGAETENIQQQTKNAKINEAILGLQEDITGIEREIKAGTKEDTISLIDSAARSAIAKANVDERTQAQLIKQINRASQEQALRIEGQQKGLIKTDAETASINQGIAKMVQEINNMIQGNMQAWDKMSQNEREIMIKQKVMEIGKQHADFNTSTPQQIKQWTDLLISIGTLGIGGQSKAGFKY